MESHCLNNVGKAHYSPSEISKDISEGGMAEQAPEVEICYSTGWIFQVNNHAVILSRRGDHSEIFKWAMV